MIQHIFFDCFGTLIDTCGVSAAATREILDSVCFQAVPEEFYGEWRTIKKRMSMEGAFRCEKELYSLSLAEMFGKYGIRADAREEVRPLIRALFGERKCFPDAKPALAALDKAGTDFALASNTDDDSLNHFLRQCGLSFERVFTSESLMAYKPDPRFYRNILERTGWDAGECLFVGDSYEEDIVQPREAGMRTALIDRLAKYADADTSAADHVITTLEMLPGIIGGGEDGPST